MAIRVAMITDYPETGDQIDGGVQAVASYLVHALTQIPDIELHVISFKNGIHGVKKTNESNFVRYSLPFSRFGTITGFAKDQAVLNECLSGIGPDIVHSQGGGHHGIVAKRSKYPTVVTIHGIGTQEAAYQRGYRAQMRTRLQGWLSNYYSVRQATDTILISPYVADHFGSALAGRKYLIPNPIHQCFFDVVRKEVPGRILFAGRLYALKGVKDLLQAASNVHSTDKPTVVLAGSMADQHYVSELKSESNRLNTSKHVEFRGALRSDELLEEFSRCTCLVLPSYQETAPMVIQEAMAAGLPVIASDICGIPYQIDDKKSGFLFPPGDTVALTERLSVLLSDEAKRNQFSAAARVRAEKEYGASAVAQKTLDVYRKMLT